MATDTATGSSGETPVEPVHIDGESALQEFVEANEVVLVDFYADWCGPCQMLEPVVERLAANTDAAVGKVDVDANQQLAATHGVQGVPTLVLFVNSDPVEEVVGMRGEDQLRSLIEEYTT